MKTCPTGPYQFDSVVFSASGETDGGITVSAKMELDNDNPASSLMVWMTEVCHSEQMQWEQ